MNFKKIEQIASLIAKKLGNKLSPEESQALAQWLSKNEGNRKILITYTDDELMLEEMTLYTQQSDPEMVNLVKRRLEAHGFREGRRKTFALLNLFFSNIGRKTKKKSRLLAESGLMDTNPDLSVSPS